MIKRILVAVDRSDEAKAAVDAAGSLAEQLNAEVALLHVIRNEVVYIPEAGAVNETVVETPLEASELLHAAASRLPTEVKHEQMVAEGEPDRVILATAQQWSADLIIIGADQRGRMAHLLLGSVADSVIRRASCPVMSVHRRSISSRPAAQLGADA